MNKKAEKLHIDIGAYDEYALVGFWRERLQIGEENEENSQEWGKNERAFEEQKARVNKIFFSDLSKFESLETADGPWDVLKTLLSVASSVLGI